jgi:hypothetical protein
MGMIYCYKLMLMPRLPVKTTGSLSKEKIHCPKLMTIPLLLMGKENSRCLLTMETTSS